MNKKKTILFIASVLCLGLLFFFKYFNFVSLSLVKLLSLFTIKLSPITLKLLMPLGISFYTFKTLSYLIDVYNGKVKAEHHLGYYAVYISFFADLIAGPIDRIDKLLPQIKSERIFNYNQATYGLKLMAWGYFKKLVVADSLAKYVNVVYVSPQSFEGFALVLATLFFSIQIYCDFSGYSDIAIGTAKLLGFELMTNFRSPYFSQSVKEFWSRWHISLSTWFRDYIYIPLGGNRCSKIRHYFNLLITFLVSGLWHGASWTFVVWGGLHGVAQIAENAIWGKAKPSKNYVMKWFRIFVVFCFSSFAWIFFVSNSMTDALYVIQNLFNGIQHPISYLHDGFSDINLGKLHLLYLSVPLLVLICFDYKSLQTDITENVENQKLWVRWTIYIVFILFTIIMLPYSNSSEFLYFKF